MLRLLRYVLLACAFTPVSGRAAEVPFQHDPVEYYGARFLTGILIVAIGLVLYSLVRYRGRIAGPVSWGLLIAGVLILPSISLLFGTLLVFERAERVEFCASCHLTMRPYVEDMKNLQSASLAAIHYKNRFIPSNQCYDCHTSYGMFGTVEAKMDGVLDVYKYYTRTFRLPIKMRRPYPNNDCLKCHAESAKFAGSHQEFKEELFAGKSTCMQCHGESNPAHILSR